MVHFSDDEGVCHIFLARYHMRKGRYPEAEAHAHKAMQIVEVTMQILPRPSRYLFLDTRRGQVSITRDIQEQGPYYTATEVD